jgi:hypothetical protein
MFITVFSNTSKHVSYIPTLCMLLPSCIILPGLHLVDYWPMTRRFDSLLILQCVWSKVEPTRHRGLYINCRRNGSWVNGICELTHMYSDALQTNSFHAASHQWPLGFSGPTY